TALEAGYRHIDTAQMYGNEREVGEAVRESGLDRTEVFVTSKLNNNAHDPKDARDATARSIDALGIGAMDLYLVHWPMPAVGDFVRTWQTMERLYEDAHTRAIGVSNFHRAHLERLFAETEIVPAVNQIEVHPYLTQVPLRDFNRSNGIHTQAWSPIAQGDVLDDPVLTAIAAETGRTVAQVVLRWHVQLGSIVFPKSTTPSRIVENRQIFDFELTADQVDRINALNADRRRGPNPDEFNWIPE
ncbi:MAG: aldo/keto reductase, partial [Gordonia sp. (in: high G+C Gram-positive bacteria)]